VVFHPKALCFVGTFFPLSPGAFPHLVELVFFWPFKNRKSTSVWIRPFPLGPSSLPPGCALGHPPLENYFPPRSLISRPRPPQAPPLPALSPSPLPPPPPPLVVFFSRPGDAPTSRPPNEIRPIPPSFLADWTARIPTVGFPGPFAGAPPSRLPRRIKANLFPPPSAALTLPMTTSPPRSIAAAPQLGGPETVSFQFSIGVFNWARNKGSTDRWRPRQRPAVAFRDSGGRHLSPSTFAARPCPHLEGMLDGSNAGAQKFLASRKPSARAKTARRTPPLHLPLGFFLARKHIGETTQSRNNFHFGPRRPRTSPKRRVCF